MTGWQPIETARKEKAGSVLGWVPDASIPVECRYFVIWWYKDGWYRAGDECDLPVEPTHWQPLPGPP